MTSHGNGHLIYLAATAGQGEQLEALLQDLLPVAEQPQDAYGSQQDTDKGTHPTMADYLEFVDKQTGLTPLLAAVFHHREACAKLLLEHGADVHHHGARSYQTPLRMAVTELDMDVDIVDLLVSHGASPFLEAKDGVNPMDEVVRLRHHRIGPMPHDLGSVLLCLRRRCPFRGHLELKVDRYLGLSQTWRKFFCVLSPREKVPGYPIDMQLLVFSKNGFDPVTSIWMTNAAPIEVPLKAAHGRACYELALSNRQQKKPGKLFAPGSSRAGFSIFVRALSKDPVEASWLRRFINLATSEPSIAMLNGDSEPPLFSRPSLNKAASPAADKSSPQLQPGPPQTGSSKHRSISFSSDSAHVPVPQAPVAPNTPAQTHNKAPVVSSQRIPTISGMALPNGIPAHTSASPSRTHSSTLQPQETPCGNQAAWESAGQGANGNGSQAAYQPGSQATNGSGSRSSSFSSSLTAAQQQPSSAATSQVVSSTSPAPASSTQVWRSNPAYGVPPTPAPTIDRTPSSHRASQSLPSLKTFTSVDKRLTDSWRAKLLEDLANESDSEQGFDLRMTLPVVSEHDSLPAMTQQWGLQSVEMTQDLQSLLHQAPEPRQHSHESSPAQTDPAAQSDSNTALLSAHAHPSDAASFPDAATSIPSHMAQAALPSYNSHPSDVLTSGDGSQYHLRQPQQHDHPDTAIAPHPQQDMTQAQAAADDCGDRGGYNMVPPAMSAVSLLSDSNLEVVKARSNMLDIPSAELLDSILDFANAVCGEQQNESAFSPLKDAHEDNWAQAEARARSEPAERRPANFCNVSMTESIEPFSDDDEVTILDTTEVKKLSPEGLQPLPEVALPLPPPGLPCQVLNPNHLDSRDDEDLVYEVQRVTLHDAPFHHYSHSPQLIQQNSPNAAARYGHMNRMYDTSTSDVSSHGAGPSASQAAKQSMRGMSLSPQPELEFGSQHQNSIYDSSGSHGMVEPDYQLYHDVIEQTELLPQMEPSEFREMIDGIMAHSEQQAAQVHMTGGAASSTSALHPIWEDEETCLEGHQSPCVATIGVPVS